MNSPEYCQGIYEAAKALVEFYEPGDGPHDGGNWFSHLNRHMLNLKRALEGKE